MDQRKTAADFLASVDVLNANLDLFHRQIRQVYRPLATELRKLLCDKPDRTLLPRVFEDVRLHKLASTERLERSPVWRDATFFSSGTLLVTREVTRYTLEFAASREQMPLDVWLQQPIMSPQMTIRDLIRSVADKEGAHSDPAPNDVLKFTGRIRYGADVSHSHEIAGIAEYIADFVRHEDLRARPGMPIERTAVGEAWTLRT
jgi:hypothetical protein